MIGTILDYDKESNVAEAIVGVGRIEVVVKVPTHSIYEFGENIEIDEELVQGAIIEQEIESIEKSRYWWQKVGLSTY